MTPIGAGVPWSSIVNANAEDEDVFGLEVEEDWLGLDTLGVGLEAEGLSWFESDVVGFITIRIENGGYKCLNPPSGGYEREMKSTV
ncbi:hypothetical protein BGZ80_004473 [Entomortierella chlamydospora]|uniref:Uncharacterized protein n=1 Tax=Entomortierella chlamydospora TaxID=101097 RepID=A0A9P6N0N6_9FUNG|nr:hypothetical protein BGZ80_004473 [Entomortierella chlamydospora]